MEAFGLKCLNEIGMAEEKSLESIYGMMEAMCRMAAIRDPNTAGHQKKAADLSTAIGREMGLCGPVIEHIGIAATVHDIGKTYVPTAILNKPGRLTELEWQLIHSHVRHGHDMLRDMGFPADIAIAVLQHHERINGSGYPLGLKGEETSVDALVLAVSDVVEAMASHRPYRPAPGIDKALEEISRNRGWLYDADVVDACMKLFTTKGFRFET